MARAAIERGQRLSLVIVLPTEMEDEGEEMKVKVIASGRDV